ncbi:sigma-70 family RNA polymerase sigma factor [Nocardioides sp. CFH 31398]|uniref:sigma-70 family RNA polymerase sigma factor n=1 Tax=Nocardioides sp. CFH 31398 TaxID=2919579 RepID=UPI001F06738C|nr:sigma-70 family RNA polymerase sigma factor [Nocardioides sp. CFH 31398]MCH1868066.1 sigma-70 family RNA polymerase sigma factor [Nocardioides sp. CFH 31398]
MSTETPRRTRRREETTRLFAEIEQATSDEERDRLRDEVVVVNLELARTLAGRYRNRGVAVEDLEQVASLALVQAVRRFLPEPGRDFLSYAVPTIRGELRKHFRDLGWIVRPPRRIQENQSRVVAAFEHRTPEGEQRTAKDVADLLGISVEDVEEAMQAQGCFHASSLDLPVGPDSTTTVAESLVRSDDETEAAENRATLEPMIACLRERDRLILRMRYVEDWTQQEIADAIGVTQMQVSRLLRRILKDLRELAAAS